MITHHHHHHHHNDNQHCHYDSKESRWNRPSVTSKPCATHQNFDEKNGDDDDEDGKGDADGDDDDGNVDADGDEDDGNGI